MPSLGAAAAACGWCPVCKQTQGKHTADCTPEKRKKHWRKMYWIMAIGYGSVILIGFLLEILK